MKGRKGRDFWEHVRITPGCWYWTASTNEHGYGKYMATVQRCVRVHRFAYELLIGPIPKKLDVDHKCHTADWSCPGGRTCLHRRCVNPDHLQAVTRSVNLSTALTANRLKTHCPQGHPYEGDNLVINSKGRRECRTCMRTRNLARYHRKKAAR